jgi:hypothetical protein
VGTEIVKFDFAAPPAETVTGLTLKLLVMRPGGDDGDDDKVTEPAKLFRLVIEIVEFAFEPRGIVREDGLDETP